MILPSDSRTVFASYLNFSGKRRWIVAEYIRQFEVAANSDDEECIEHNEEDDTYYKAEGWYELIDNWEDYSSVLVIRGNVDRWQELPRDEQ